MHRKCSVTERLRDMVIQGGRVMMAAGKIEQLISFYRSPVRQIMGASGSGKTSLLRAIAGLWRSGSGTIKRYVKHRVGGAEQDGVSDNNQSQSDKGLSPDKEWIAEVTRLH